MSKTLLPVSAPAAFPLQQGFQHPNERFDDDGRLTLRLSDRPATHQTKNRYRFTSTWYHQRPPLKPSELLFFVVSSDLSLADLC